MEMRRANGAGAIKPLSCRHQEAIRVKPWHTLTTHERTVGVNCWSGWETPAHRAWSLPGSRLSHRLPTFPHDSTHTHRRHTGDFFRSQSSLNIPRREKTLGYVTHRYNLNKIPAVAPINTQTHNKFCLRCVGKVKGILYLLLLLLSHDPLPWIVTKWILSCFNVLF